MRKSLSLFLVALFCLGAIVVTPTATAVTTNSCTAPCTGLIEFIGLDRQRPGLDSDADGINELLGTGAVAIVHVHDTDITGSSSITVTVSARGETDSTKQETITLVQEGATGHFYGTFGVETSNVAGNGRVLVAHGQELAAKYNDASPAGEVQTNAGVLEWLSRPNAATPITFLSSTYYGLNTVGQVRVDDPDRNNLTSVAETVQVRITSVTDPRGFVLNLTETGANTGIFQSNLTGGSDVLTFAASSSGSAIGVSNGEVVTAHYREPVDALGRANEVRTATATWVKTTNASLVFTDATYRLVVAGYHGQGAGIGHLRAEDPDLAGTGTVVVRVTSDTSTTGIDVTLTETVSGSGEFVGDFGMTQGSTSGLLQVDDDDLDNIHARITDARDQFGALVNVTAPSVPWRDAQTAIIRFRQNDQFASDATTFSVGGLNSSVAFVEIIDAEADVSTGADTIQARVVNLDRDPIGLVVTLLETGAQTGLFRGCFRFNNETGNMTNTAAGLCDDGDSSPTGTAATSAGQLIVRTNDDIVASYIDNRTANGGSNVTISTAAMTSHTTSRDAGTANPTAGQLGAQGDLKIQRCILNCHSEATAVLETITDGLWGVGNNSVVYVNITDGNYNLNAIGNSSSTPSVVNSFTVFVSSKSSSNATSPGSRLRWDTTGNLTPGGTGISVTVTETTATSGVFLGKFNLSLGGSNDTTDHLHVGNATDPFQDTIEVAYAYSPIGNASSDGDKVARLGVVTKSVGWRAADLVNLTTRDALREGGVDTAFVGLETAYIRLTGADAKEDTTTGRDQVTVTVSSNANPTGISVTLNERYRNAPENQTFGALHNTTDDAFLGSFTFSTTASGTNTIQVLPAGDTVQVRYNDPRNLTGLPQPVITSLSWLPGTLGTLSILDPVSLDPVTVVRSAANNTLVRVQDTTGQTLSVLVTGDTPAANGLPERFLLPLTETPAASGIYQATLITELGEANASRILVVDGSKITVTYSDAGDANGTRQNVTASYRYFNDTNGGVLTLNKAAYVGTETATITLWDPNADTTGSADTVRVRVLSESDGSGELITLNETGSQTDNFTGTFSFETARTASNQRIFMTTAGEQVTVYYADCPANLSSTSCDPIGSNTANTAARLARATWTLTGVLNAPSASLSTNVSSGIAPLVVAFTTSGTDVDNNIVSYSLNFGDSTTAAQGSNPNGVINHTYAIEGTYTATLTVTDASGLAATATATITVTSNDNDAPGAISTLAAGTALSNSVALNWTAPGDDGTTGTVAAYRVYVSTVEITASNIGSLTPWPTANLTFVPATLVAAGTVQGVTVSGLNSSVPYFFAVRAVDEGANVGAISNVVSKTTATPDTSPPTGTLVITSSTHEAAVATTNDDPTFAWSGLTDAESTITYRYALNQVLAYTLTSSDTTTTGTNVTLSNIAAGTWYFHVRGESPGGNSAPARYTIIIEGVDEIPTELTPEDIQDANEDIELTVERIDGANVLSFELPSNTPADVLGVQIWRSNSPYELIDDLPAGSDEFEDGEYVDDSSEAKATSKYLVTMYYGNTEELGYFDADSAPDTDDYPGVAFSTDDGDGGLSTLSWALIGLGAIVLIALIVILIVVLAKRGKKDETAEGGDDVAWDNPPAGAAAAAPVTSETHHIRCPACQTSFTATGAKPLTTTCPGCGRRGVLR